MIEEGSRDYTWRIDRAAFVQSEQDANTVRSLHESGFEVGSSGWWDIHQVKHMLQQS